MCLKTSIMNPYHQLFNNKAFLFFISLSCITTILCTSCKKNEKWIDVDPAYSKYVEAYTTGMISKTSAIRVQLASEASTTHTVGQPLTEQLFSLSPSIKGTAAWIDARTIEFK